MRVLVCGGRGFGLIAPGLTDAERENREVSARAERHCLKAKLMEMKGKGMSLLIHGAAKGADTLAGAWADFNNVPTEVYPADWHRYGRSAGAIRNEEMLERGQPHLVVAFPGGRGTAHMVQISREAGVPVECLA